MRDRGSVVVMVAVSTMALMVPLLVGTAWFAGRLGDRGRARVAADAAALAGVSGGRRAAELLARDNGGRLVDWQLEVDGAWFVVRVVVEVDRTRATARATDAP